MLMGLSGEKETSGQRKVSDSKNWKVSGSAEIQKKKKKTPLPSYCSALVYSWSRLRIHTTIATGNATLRLRT